MLREAARTGGHDDAMNELSNTHVAVLVTEGFEQAELVEPVKALRAAGAEGRLFARSTRGAATTARS